MRSFVLHFFSAALARSGWSGRRIPHEIVILFQQTHSLITGICALCELHTLHVPIFVLLSHHHQTQARRRISRYYFDLAHHHFVCHTDAFFFTRALLHPSISFSKELSSALCPLTRP
ncbi:hypothetical protein B0J12DRAFT_647450 [Macrophomina phaseolina]|uniref:Secreted protein n=1 Tax=Macrophomina phaseolina TaxID=35725 RepID=A0ABQ8GNI4_9PEZI|nr:hypothetical protein B0J12DRAFT_647450 [Macrophomina phaseolina]